MNTYERIWKKLLADVLFNGSPAKKDDAEILEKIGNHVFVPNPYYYTNYINMMDAGKFAEAVKHGNFDVEGYFMKSEALYDYVKSIHDDNQIYLDEDGFIYTYSERLQNYFQHDFEYEAVNQVNVMLERLVQNTGSNRAVAVTLIPQWDCDREDIPCLQVVQALIRENELILSVFFRSNDLFGAWISNMLFLTHFGLLLVDELKSYYPQLVFRGIDYHSSSLHIYKPNIEDAQKVV